MYWGEGQRLYAPQEQPNIKIILCPDEDREKIIIILLSPYQLVLHRH